MSCFMDDVLKHLIWEHSSNYKFPRTQYKAFATACENIEPSKINIPIIIMQILYLPLVHEPYEIMHNKSDNKNQMYDKLVIYITCSTPII